MMQSLLSSRLFSRIAVLAGVFTIAVLLAACTGLDVVATGAGSSFEKLLKTLPPAAVSRVGTMWTVQSPGGEVFAWSADFSARGPDLLLQIPAGDLLRAGLDPARLPRESMGYINDSREISFSLEVGSDQFASRSSENPALSFREIIEKHRARFGYHPALDHFNISLGRGNLVEWASDFSKNDKDLVFVLDPAPFLAAGLEPARLKDWVLAKVEVVDEKGAKLTVDKLLRVYNLQ
jgi:hypothetical protein